MTTLLPCPFCGHRATNPQDKPRNDLYWISCTHCEAEMSWGTREGVIERWNARAVAPSPSKGWKLVPIEPTAEMIHAMRYEGAAPLGYEASYAVEGPWPNFGEGLARRAYQLAIGAA